MEIGKMQGKCRWSRILATSAVLPAPTFNCGPQFMTHILDTRHFVRHHGTIAGAREGFSL
jgi:hypothetical protein